MTAGVDIEAGSALADLATAAELIRNVAARLSPEQVWACTSAEVVALLRAGQDAASACEAVGLAAVREADVRSLAADAGQPSTRTWLAQLLLLTPGEAKARINAADVTCRRARELGTALAGGAVNTEQARAISWALGKVEKVASAAEYTAAEHTLVAGAKAHDGNDLRRLGRRIVEVLDPDGTPERADRAREDRSLSITNLGNGRHRVRGTLTDEGAAILKAALDPLAAPRPAQDGVKDPRTASQRLVDALVELASGYLRWGELPSTRGARPHVHITVTLDTLRGDGGHPFARAATGEDLTTETVRKFCCDAGLTPIVVNTLGEPLDIGRESRLMTPAIWAALLARDIGCVFAGCTRPAAWCQGHHIRFWADFGPTELRNLALLCDYHHDQVHHHGWQIRLGADGHPELIPPPWVDPLQRPQRNAHWRLARDGLKTDPDRGP